MPGKKGVVPPGFKRYIEEKRALKAEKEEALRQSVETGAPVDEQIAAAMPGDLGAVFLEFKRASEAKDADAALTKLREAMGNLSADTVAVLRETEAYKSIVQRVESAQAERKPGDPIRNEQGAVIGYVSWQREDFKQGQEPVTFIGEENLVFHINGVEFMVGDGVRTTLPAGVYDYYMENRQDRKVAASGKAVREWLDRMSGGKAIWN